MLPLVVFIFISPVVALFIAAAITSGFSCPTGWAFILYVVLMTLQDLFQHILTQSMFIPLLLLNILLTEFLYLVLDSFTIMLTLYTHQLLLLVTQRRWHLVLKLIT